MTAPHANAVGAISAAAPRGFAFDRGRKYFLTVTISMLAATILLKVSEIQYLEILLAVDFLFVLGFFLRDGLQTEVYRPYFKVGAYFGLFAAGAILLSLVALRQDFYSFNDSLLKKPFLVTLSRIAELFLDVFYMLYMANIYRSDEKLCRLGTLTYYWTGIAGCIYSIVTFPANYFLESQLGTYSTDHRFRGFTNEGGPFGVYLISVWVLTGAIYRKGWISKRKFLWSTVLFGFCLIGSQSKSAFFAMVVLGLVDLMWLLRGWRRWATVGAMVATAFVVATIIDLPGQIDVFLKNSANYQKYAYLRPTDGNFVMGRISGAVLAPRMIAAHPLVGVGLGNYSLVRDDPPYRQGTPYSLGSLDSPGLGVVDYIVDLGFPLFFFFCWTELQPALLLRRYHANIWIVNMALIQPLSNWFGAHLNLTYPWVVVGFALGMGFRKSQGTAEPALLRDKSQ